MQQFECSLMLSKLKQTQKNHLNSVFKLLMLILLSVFCQLHQLSTAGEKLFVLRTAVLGVCEILDLAEEKVNFCI